MFVYFSLILITCQSSLHSSRLVVVVVIYYNMSLEVFILFHKTSLGRLHGWQPWDLNQNDLTQNFGIGWKLSLGIVRTNMDFTSFQGNGEEFAFSKRGSRAFHDDNQINWFGKRFWQWHAKTKVFGNNDNRIVGHVQTLRSLDSNGSDLRTVGVTEIIRPLTWFRGFLTSYGQDFVGSNARVGASNLEEKWVV